MDLRRRIRVLASLTGSTGMAGVIARLDRIPNFGFQLDPVETVGLLDAGGLGDVDFSEVFAADDVDPDEDQPALL